MEGNFTVNPWLAGVIEEFRRCHSDDELRMQYQEELEAAEAANDDSEPDSWSDFIGGKAFEWKIESDPILATSTEDMPISDRAKITFWLSAYIDFPVNIQIKLDLIILV